MEGRFSRKQAIFSAANCCLSNKHGRLYCGEIDHPPWPFQGAEAEIETNTMTLPYDIPLLDSAPLLHFSRRQDVVVWPLHRVENGGRVGCDVKGRA